MPSLFRSLRGPDFRCLAAGTLVVNIGSWMQRIAQDWIVLELTGSGAAVGLTTALQFLPMLLVAPLAGKLADRLPKRRIIAAAGASTGVAAVTLGVLVLTGAVQVWHVLTLAALVGIGTAVDTPVRQAFTRELVDPDDVSNAVGLTAASFHLARIAGPALAGLLIHRFGTGPVFLAIALSCVVAVLALAPIRPRRAPGRATGTGTTTPGADHSLRAALRSLRSHPDTFVMVGVASLVFAFTLNFQVVLTLMATGAFGLSADGLGMLASAMAAGSITGALISAARRTMPRWLVLGSATAVGIMWIAASLVVDPYQFAASMFLTGLVTITFATSSNARIQLVADPSMQGRVMAMYLAACSLGAPIVAPVIGSIADAAGPRRAMMLGGCWILGAVVAGALALLLRERRTAGHLRVLSPNST